MATANLTMKHYGNYFKKNLNLPCQTEEYQELYSRKRHISEYDEKGPSTYHEDTSTDSYIKKYNHLLSETEKETEHTYRKRRISNNEEEGHSKCSHYVKKCEDFVNKTKEEQDQSTANDQVEQYKHKQDISIYDAFLPTDNRKLGCGEKNISTIEDKQGIYSYIRTSPLELVAFDKKFQHFLHRAEEQEHKGRKICHSDNEEEGQSLSKEDIKVEVDLDSDDADSCKKNPDHSKFITLNDFSTDSLPTKYQDEDLRNTILTLGELTVQVKVHIAGERNVKLGSGKVIDVMENKSTAVCPCSKCKHTSTHSKTWWKIIILTSNHVVCDNEAKGSTCRLFYDSPDSPKVILDGISVIKSMDSTDVCQLVCASCDKDLVDRLDKVLDNFTELYEKTFDKFWDVKNPEKLVVIVSHPHGYPKRVSIGKSGQTNQYQSSDFSDGDKVLSYTTSTCPGSTGAFLYIV